MYVVLSTPVFGFLQAVVKRLKSHNVISIANGGSSNNRNFNTHESVRRFWSETGADSLMLARAAEWNPAIFSPTAKVSVLDMVGKYMDLAVEFDMPFVIVKYNLQQLLGGEQANPDYGPKFLASGTVKDLAEIFGKLDDYNKRQASLTTGCPKVNMP